MMELRRLTTETTASPLPALSLQKASLQSWQPRPLIDMQLLQVGMKDKAARHPYGAPSPSLQ